ncbi:MAG TPA: class I SAM-dependent methyltransferase [Prolixibacteraceae bacterium]|nr:class I SAM-dependent methyltransferase [Prolixibacteraceae bacterium]
MNNFNQVAREWDKDKMHMDRSVAIAAELEKMVPLNPSMKALEYGAGTGILSFLLKDRFSEITLMDNSVEMVKVCAEKTEFYQTNHILPICFDLEHKDYDDHFDIIYNQMVLHHVNDYEAIIYTFFSMLNPGGYLAIADLYTEDGSFHGPDVKVHLGFDPEKLAKLLRKIGFKNIKNKTCFEVKRETGIKYPVFLLVAQK